jgi:hypothetical protein
MGVDLGWQSGDHYLAYVPRYVPKRNAQSKACAPDSIGYIPLLRLVLLRQVLLAEVWT